eukprot:762806-Pyramimonas_sp.AAC.1
MVWREGTVPLAAYCAERGSGRARQLEAVRSLLMHGADVEQPTKDAKNAMTPLMLAVKWGA